MAASVQVPNLAAEVSALSLREEDSREVNFDQINYKSAIYKLRQIQQNNGGSAVTLSANATTQSLFNIPNETFNLARSYVTLDVTIAAYNPGNAALVAAGHTLFTDCIPVDNLKFKPSAGDPIVQIDNAQAYSKFSQAATIDFEEYISRGGVYADTAIGTSYPISECLGCQPYQQTSDRTNIQLSPSEPSDAYIISASSVSRTTGNTSQLSGTGTDEKAPQHLVSGTFVNNAATNNIVVRWKIPLSAFSGTVLAMDRSICYGQIMQLYFNWAPYSRWGFVSGVDDAAVAAAAGPPAVQIQLPGPFQAAPTISNLYLYLANDISDSGREIMMLSQTTGIQMTIPYLDCSSYTPAAAGVNSVPYQLTPGTGTLLKRVMTAVANNTNTLDVTANLNNVSSLRFSTVQSYLDSKPLQDYQLTVADSTLWQYMQPMIKHTPAGIDQRNYLINCFYLDNFSDCNSSSEWLENDLKVSGLSINQPRNYAIKMTTTANSIVYLFAVWSRNLIIRPSGISWAA